jgi:hypothetical protein
MACEAQSQRILLQEEDGGEQVVLDLHLTQEIIQTGHNMQGSGRDMQVHGM